VDADVDTLLTALYCFTDDLLITRRFARSTPAAHRCRVGVSGRGADSAQPALRSSVVAVCPQAPVRHVPLSAQTVGLEQTAPRGRATDHPPDSCSGRGHSDQRGPVTAHRLHTGRVRPVPAHRETLRPGRLRLLRLSLPLLLGHAPLPRGHRRGHADHVVSGQPQTRRTRGHASPHQGRPPSGHRRPSDPGRQRLRRTGLRTVPRRPRHPPGPPGPHPGSNEIPNPTPSSVGCCVYGNGSKPSSTPSKANSHSSSTAPDKPTGSTPASANDYWPWPPRSGTTPTSAHPAHDPSSPTTIRNHSSR
jgi:hypothetical protein